MLKTAEVAEAAVSTNDQPASTLENLDTNVATELAAQADVNAGVVPDTTTPASGEPEAAPGTPVEGTPEAEADQGKASRLSQQNAQMRAALTKFGVDPDGDTIEAINTGLVTIDEVIAARQPIAPTAASTPTAPEPTLGEKINNLKSVLAVPIPEKGLSSQDVQERQEAFLDVIATQAEQINNVTKTQDQDRATVEANKSVAAINTVFDEQITPILPTGLSEELKQTATQMFLATVDFSNDDLVRSHGKAKAQTPEGYTFTAKKVAPQFAAVLKGAFDAGIASTGAAPAVPAVPNAGVHNVTPPNVLKPAVGGAPPAPVNTTKFTLGNLEANANNYLAAQQPRV